jgi:1-acyl-sn-glycerol-3-phosphate acyltransferase
MYAQTPELADLQEAELYQDPLDPYTAVDTLRSLLLWPVAITQMAGWLPLFWLLDRTLVPGRRIDGLARLVCWLGTRSVGIQVRQHGLEHIDRERGYLIALNHVSLLDTPVLVQSVPIYARSFQDAGQFKIPLYGSFARLMGQLPVRRNDKELNQRSYRQALDMLNEGHSFAVFPEGHRTRDGRLGPFYPGAFRLAIEAGVPVLPVCSRGLRNLCPAREWRMRPGRVDVLFGEPIPTDGLNLDDVEQLAVRTRARMNDLLLGNS